MSGFLYSVPFSSLQMKKQFLNPSTSSSKKPRRSGALPLGNNSTPFDSKNNETTCFFNPADIQRPIIKEALKEPVAFMGGVFAGLLRLDLNEDPLREWVTRTLESAGITEEEIATTQGSKLEQAPLEIEIE